MASNFSGVIIEESLENKAVLEQVKIVSTKVEAVTPQHKTPWVTQWTLHTVSIPAEKIADVAKEISRALDSQHAWYADFKDATWHYIIYRGKVFSVNRKSKVEYDAASRYGVSLGIPEYQVDFHPDTEEWER